MMSVDRRRTPPGPRLGGSVIYLLMNLPLGIASGTLLVTLISVGVSTAVVWVGLPLSALAILVARGSARLERARVYALLDTYIATPYLPLPESGRRDRWVTRLRDVTTWRDVTYLVLLFPLGIVEFVLVVTFWATGLGLVALPVYYRYLPGGAYYFPGYDLRWITVDSTIGALPWAALGVLFVALSIALTKGLAAAHTAFARSLLGPTRGQERRLERLCDDIDSALGGRHGPAAPGERTGAVFLTRVPQW